MIVPLLIAEVRLFVSKHAGVKDEDLDLDVGYIRTVGEKHMAGHAVRAVGGIGG